VSVIRGTTCLWCGRLKRRRARFCNHCTRLDLKSDVGTNLVDQLESAPLPRVAQLLGYRLHRAPEPYTDITVYFEPCPGRCDRSRLADPTCQSCAVIYRPHPLSSSWRWRCLGCWRKGGRPAFLRAALGSTEPASPNEPGWARLLRVAGGSCRASQSKRVALEISRRWAAANTPEIGGAFGMELTSLAKRVLRHGDGR
jgi:hypothetical protein